MFESTGRGEVMMGKIIVPLILAFLLGFQVQANAMQLEGEEKAYSTIYKPTVSAVKKTMTKMGYEFTVDDDGDLKYKFNRDNGQAWGVYVIFDELSSGKVWNLKMIAHFATKKSRYDELVQYANSWNYKKKYPKISMKDRDTLRLSLNYPIQYGFNPDEFEDNVIGMFERALNVIADETEAMRR
jgi:hypothetical protein